MAVQISPGCRQEQLRARDDLWTLIQLQELRLLLR
jgi:hypothetical protein